jgi:hypothetical protein
MTEERLQRMIDRAKQNLKDLEDRKESLSKNGYWDIGYFQGRISVLEDWLADIREHKS